MVATLKRDFTAANTSHSVESKSSPLQLALTGNPLEAGYQQSDELKSYVRHCTIYVQCERDVGLNG